MRFSKAPIIEAIIDLRVTLPTGSTVDTIIDVYDSIATSYPSKEPLYAGSLQLEPISSIDIRLTDSQHHQGFRFASEDRIRIFQATINGFTVNRLAPYDSWDSFRHEAKKLWQVYKEVCKPLEITRVAVRYINRLELPGPSLDFKDYLRTTPEIAPGLPQGLSAFFMQLQVPQEDLDALLVINEAFDPPTKNPEIIPIILDFDLFRVNTWHIDQDEEVWEYLELLRHRKNLAFRESITPTTERLIA